MIGKLDAVFLGGMATALSGSIIAHEVSFVMMGVGALISMVALVQRGDDDGGEM